MLKVTGKNPKKKKKKRTLHHLLPLTQSLTSYTISYLFLYQKVSAASSEYKCL